MNLKPPNRRRLAAIALLLAMPICSACRRDTPDFGQLREQQAEVTQPGDPLGSAFDYLNRLDEFEAARIQPRILYYLNQWIGHQQADDTWSADPLYAGLPERLAVHFPADELSRLSFGPRDIDMLRESVWMRDIAQSVVSRRRQQSRRGGEPVGATAWRDQLAEQQGERAAEDLQIVCWLFDWTVRHVQLDAMPEEVIETAAPDGTDSPKPPRDTIQPARADPGGRLTTWEVLLLGHGDALERAKVFIGLARQQGIAVVMLHPGDGDPRRGWLAGALIGEDLYLFDPKLGLPVPGPDGRPAATLAEAVADPAVIRALDVDDRHRYPLKHSEIESMVASIDAPAGFLTRRMGLVERQLSGNSKTVLTINIQSLAQRLRNCAGVADVRLWLAPYETQRYRVELDRLLQTLARARRTSDRKLADRVLAACDQEAIERLDQEMRVFTGLTPIVRGRLLQFRGRFDKQDQQSGAKAFLMQCRPAEEQIEQVRTDRLLQRRLVEEQRLPDETNDELLQRAVEQRIAFIRRIKQDASYWLGQIAYEDGNYQAAAHFFDQLTLQATPDGPWTSGAQYNLARAHEMLAHQTGLNSHYERAIELYRADRSPQQLGNLVRAKRLEAEMAAGSEDEGTRTK